MEEHIKQVKNDCIGQLITINDIQGYIRTINTVVQVESMAGVIHAYELTYFAQHAQLSEKVDVGDCRGNFVITTCLPSGVWLAQDIRKADRHRVVYTPNRRDLVPLKAGKRYMLNGQIPVLVTQLESDPGCDAHLRIEVESTVTGLFASATIPTIHSRMALLSWFNVNNIQELTCSRGGDTHGNSGK